MGRLACFTTLVVLLATGAATQTITTVAGDGSWGHCGDGGPATTACLKEPHKVAADAVGNVFIADRGNQRIRRVDTTGTITTVAGSGAGGYCGDGGPATSACFNSPWSVVVDAAGNLFIADGYNHRVRRVDSEGTIATVAGNGAAASCGDGGPATSACLNRPVFVAVDGAGNLFIAENIGNRIRRVHATTGTITTVAGGGSAYPGDGGPATSAALYWPTSVAVDTLGNVYFSEAGHDRIRKVDATGIITTFAGTGIEGFSGDGGPATAARLHEPWSVAVDELGNLFIADVENNRIRKVDTSGTITTFAGSTTGGYCGDGGAPTSACLNWPSGVTVSSSGAVLIADSLNNRIRKVEAATMASLSLAKPIVSGCLKTTGKVTLSEPAPAGGLVVDLRSSNPDATVPASITLKAGALSKTFPIATSPVAVLEASTIEAYLQGQTLSTVLTLKPMWPKSVLLTPNPVVGGNAVSGQVTLECPAGPGDIEVRLTSTKPLVASPTVTSLVVPVGTKVMPFVVTTNPVSVVTKPAIKATTNGVTRSKALVVNPAP